MKILKFFGSLLYGAIMYYLLWLLFYWLTPYVMSMSWGWFIAYMFIAGGFVSCFIAQIAYWIAIPLIFLCINCKPAKYAQIVPAILFGISSVKLPWILNMDYGILQWILGISLTIIVLIAFISLIVAPFKADED